MIIVTVNGITVKEYLKEEGRAEARESYAATARAIGFLVARSRGTASRRSVRNSSGARTGRGRVVFSAAQEGAQ